MTEKEQGDLSNLVGETAGEEMRGSTADKACKRQQTWPFLALEGATFSFELPRPISLIPPDPLLCAP